MQRDGLKTLRFRFDDLSRCILRSVVEDQHLESPMRAFDQTIESCTNARFLVASRYQNAHRKLACPLHDRRVAASSLEVLKVLYKQGKRQ